MDALIKSLCCSSFVSGCDKLNQSDTIIDQLKNRNIPYEQDVIGNVIFKKEGNGEKTLMLVAHYDEIGFSVKYIDDNGYIYFSAIGGIDTSILRGQRVVITHDGQPIHGVIGAKPVHMMNNTRNRNNKSIDISDLWIDIGVSENANVRDCVSVGDTISFLPCFMELKDNLISSKSIDNRVGVAALFLLYEGLRNVKNIDYKNIYFVLSSQEELGLRGAQIAGYNINPDICIAIDVTHSTDYPTINKNKYGDIRLNKGAVIPFGSSFSSSLQKKLICIAKKYDIPYQIESLPGHSGTDISVIQLSRGGCESGLISIPCRYMHTPIELASYNDTKSAADILLKYCCNQ